jgi:hypothetical protein
VGQELFTRPPDFSPSLSGIRVVRSLVSNVLFCRSFFLFDLTIVLSVIRLILITPSVSSNFSSEVQCGYMFWFTLIICCSCSHRHSSSCVNSRRYSEHDHSLIIICSRCFSVSCKERVIVDAWRHTCVCRWTIQWSKAEGQTAIYNTIHITLKIK